MTSSPADLTIASLNLRWGRHVDGGAIDVAAALDALDADVVLLQEVWQPRGGARTLEPAHSRGYHVVELPLSDRGLPSTLGFAVGGGPGEGSWGLAILSRLPLTAHAAVPLGAVRLDPVGTRAALRAELAWPEGQACSVVNVHLSHRPYGSPLQLRRLMRVLASEAPPLAVGGDFNTFGIVSRALAPRLRATIGAPSWPAHKPRFGLDQIFVAPDVELRHAAVCDTVGSDHRPVLIGLRVKPATLAATARQAA